MTSFIKRFILSVLGRRRRLVHRQRLQPRWREQRDIVPRRVTAQPAVELLHAHATLELLLLDEAAHAADVHRADLHLVVARRRARAGRARGQRLVVAEARLKLPAGREGEPLEAEDLSPAGADVHSLQELARGRRPPPFLSLSLCTPPPTPN